MRRGQHQDWQPGQLITASVVLCWIWSALGWTSGSPSCALKNRSAHNSSICWDEGFLRDSFLVSKDCDLGNFCYCAHAYPEKNIRTQQKTITRTVAGFTVTRFQGSSVLFHDTSGEIMCWFCVMPLLFMSFHVCHVRGAFTFSGFVVYVVNTNPSVCFTSFTF